MNEQSKIKSELQLGFERWAGSHQFLCDWDIEHKIYTNVYTQGAWMAFEEGYRQCWDVEE